MKRLPVARHKSLAAFCLSATMFIAVSAQTSLKDPVFQPAAILEKMEQVANWQLRNWDTGGFQRRKYDWTYAAAYAGLAELPPISKNKSYETLLTKIGN